MSDDNADDAWEQNNRNVADIDGYQVSQTQNQTSATPQTQQPQKAHPIVLFCGGLTSRMGFSSQRFVANWADKFIYLFTAIAYITGWYLQTFSLVIYSVLGIGVVAFLVFVPNWQAAWRSAKTGKLVNGDGDITFLPNSEVRRYYEDLRRDELNVDANKRPPQRGVKS